MITGELVRLRPIDPDDLEFLRSLANSPDVAQWLVGAGMPISVLEQQRWYEAASRDQSTIRLLVEDATTTSSVGITGLWDIDWRNRSALTAAKFSGEHRGRGLGTDTIMTTMAWAFGSIGLRRLHSSILDFNTASLLAYVRKCGWRIEGCEKAAVFRNGRWCDRYLVAILDEEFRRLPRATEYLTRVCVVDVSPKALSDLGLE
jgi:RimJ/RimL family protein N-acetyltransferase